MLGPGGLRVALPVVRGNKRSGCGYVERLITYVTEDFFGQGPPPNHHLLIHLLRRMKIRRAGQGGVAVSTTGTLVTMLSDMIDLSYENGMRGCRMLDLDCCNAIRTRKKTILRRNNTDALYITLDHLVDHGENQSLPRLQTSSEASL